MTDQGPRSLLPGSALPGAAMRAPYGMTPGKRALLPGVNDMSASAWNKPPEPDKIDLDTPTPNPPPPGAQPDAGDPVGYELTMSDGSIARFTSGAHKKRDTELVQRLGNALLTHAANDADKATAARAMDWGMAQVGRMDAAEITKNMAHMWDQGTGNALKTELQGIRSKANRGGTGGVPNPVMGANGLPSVSTKQGLNLDEHLRDRADQIIESERKNSKSTSLSDLDNQLNAMEANLNSGNPMAERIATMQQLLILTGKASTVAEREGLTASSGKWDELKNKLSMWTSTDPNLSDAYVSRFRQQIATQRAAIAKMREQIAINAATRAQEAAGGFGPQAASAMGDYVYGAMSGHHRGGSYKPPGAEEPAAAPKPTAAPAGKPPGDNSDLYAP